MTMDYSGDIAVVAGVASVEDAEGLLQWLQSQPAPRVDLAACTHVHAACLQALMAAAPAISDWPADAETRAWLEAALQPKEH